MILAGAAVAFVAGVVLGSAIGLPGWILLGLVLLFLLAAVVTRRGRAWLIFVLAAALCLGFWRAPHLSPATPGDLRYYNGRVVEVTGTVSAEPDIRDTGANYQISVDSLQTRSATRQISGGLYLHTSSAVHLEYGDRVSVNGRLLHTGTSGFASFLAHQGIYSEVDYPRLIDLGPSTSVSWFSRQLNHLRRHIEDGIDAWLPEPEAALLIAITLGSRSSELGDLAPILVTTGLIHLIAISGIKVALVAGMIQQAIRSFAGRLFSFLGAVGALWLYVLLTGFTASGVRSAGMWSLVFIASALGRGTVTLLSLAVVAAIMVGVDPSLPWDIGFELSVVGTFAIVAFAGPIDYGLAWLRLPLRAAPTSGSPARSGIPVLPSPFREAFAVTVVAQIATAPIVILGFHVLSLTGPLSNALVLPLLPLLIVIGFVLGAVSGLSAMAAPLAALAYALLHIIVVIAKWFAGGGLAPSLSPCGPVSVGLFYGALATLAWFVTRRLRLPGSSPYRGQRLELAIAGVIALLLASIFLAPARAASPTRLTWLDTGNAMLLQSGGMTALIDGSSHPFVLLERLGSLLPYDTRQIDVIVVTDPRAKNVSGLESVLAHYHVGEVLDVGVEYPSSTYARWRAGLRDRRIPVYALRTGASIALGPARIVAIGPDAPQYKPQDSAGLLRITLPHRTFLVATAADVREQHEALFRYVSLHADELITGKDRDPDFIRAVAARRLLDSERMAKGVAPLYP